MVVAFRLPTGAALGLHGDRGLSQPVLGNFLDGGAFPATQENYAVHVSQDRFRVIFVNGLALRVLLVEQAQKFVRNNTGGTKFDNLIPFVAALFTTSVVSNLISLTGLRSPTADLSTEAAWAVVVFIMITSNKIKAGGILGYLKGFTTPIPVMTPFNVLSELATPVSMACRHFGNILSGVVINGLIYAALAVATSALLGWLPGALGQVLGSIPFLDVGIPAILSVYFDWFSGFMQAFIFSMLTIMYIANAAEG